ncbi:MAG: alpha/beta fold hydrolase [Rhodocyclaceae bacterium]
MTGSWLLRFVPREHATGRIFCFPYAGVGASIYRHWSPPFMEQVEVCAVQLPGREGRFREAPLTSVAEIVTFLAAELQPFLDRPFAFFGHSMGAVIAYELAQKLGEIDAPLPAHLFLSGRRAPRMADTRQPLHVLSDEDFLAEIMRRYGGIPDEVLNEPELLDLLLPSLRADIKALETHSPAARQALDCPISVFGGEDDPLALRDELEAWAYETTGPFSLRLFPGGHFFLGQHRDALLRDIAASFAPLLASRARTALAL